MSRSREALVPAANQVSPRKLGVRLRNSRLQLGHSLAEVAKATGISSSFLSLLEKGETDVTLGRLFALLSYYNLNAADLLNDESDQVVVRGAEAPYLFSVAQGMEMYGLTAQGRGRPFFPMLGVYEPGSGMPEASEHPGDEFLYVVDGSIRLELDETVTVLKKGDSAYFPARRPHRVRTEGKRTARVLTVTSETLVP